MKAVFSAIHDFFEVWFHKRNLIIVSERQVKHVPISARNQFIVLTALLGCVCLASYSTGSYMAAQSLVKERTQALRSITSARTQNGLSSVVQVAPLDSDLKTAAATPIPLLTPAVLDHGDLFERIAFLEQRVTELTNANDTIVSKVREKTAGRINNIERLINAAGLNVDDLKNQVSEAPSPSESKGKKAEGGPFIPDDLSSMPEHADEMFANLEELDVLQRVIDILPSGLPVHNAKVQSNFGHRIDPFNGNVAFHGGIDMSAAYGEPIYTTGDGVVVEAGRRGAYGYAVDVDHGFGIVTRYGHMSEILVDKGDRVRKGDIVGLEGSTGRSTGPHLHYEVRYHDRPINPKNFLDPERYVSKK